MAEGSNSESSGYVLPEQARDDGSSTDASSGYAIPQEAQDDQTTTATDSGYFSDTNSSLSTTSSDDDLDDRHDQNRNLNNDLDEGYDDTAHDFDDGGDGGREAQGNGDGYQPGPLHQRNLFPLHGMWNTTSPNRYPIVPHQFLQLLAFALLLVNLVTLISFSISAAELSKAERALGALNELRALNTYLADNSERQTTSATSALQISDLKNCLFSYSPRRFHRRTRSFIAIYLQLSCNIAKILLKQGNTLSVDEYSHQSKQTMGANGKRQIFPCLLLWSNRLFLMSWFFCKYPPMTSSWSMFLEMYDRLHWGDLIKLLIFRNPLFEELMRQHTSFQHYLPIIRKYAANFIRSLAHFASYYVNESKVLIVGQKKSAVAHSN